MKKIAVTSIIVLLLVIAWFEVVRFRKYNPPSTYEYTFNQGVDIHYHDQALVQLYFESARRAGTLGSEMWSTYKIDVKAPDAENSTAMNAAYEYNSLLSRVQFIEQKLLQSQKWKDDGFSNQEIAMMEEKGLSPEAVRFQKIANGGSLKFGDKNSAVWEVQKLLNKKGFEIPTDAVFQAETVNAIKSFQQKNNLFPSGVADLETIEKLLQ